MARPLVIPILGNTSDLEAALNKAGVVAEDASKKIQGSFRSAGVAAADEAKKIGAGMDAQAAAAGRAAAAFTEMSAKITTAQRNAGKAAATAAGAVGASVDEQRAAYRKAIAVQSEYEAAMSRATAAAKTAAAEQAAAAEAAAAKVAAASAKQAAAVESAQKKMSTLGKVALAGGAVAVVFSVKGAVDLQKQMEMLHTQAGASQAQVNSLTKSVIAMAGSVGTGPKTLADGMYHVVSSLNATLPAATRSATELKVLRVAAEGAKVGNADLVDVTNALDAAIVSGVKGVQNYHQAMGALNSIVGAGDMKMQDLADALSTGLLGPMKTYGLSLKDVGGALAVFGDNNIRGQEAATKLTSAVRIMAAPSQAAAKALGVINLSTLQLANDMRSGGLTKALADLKSHLTDSGATASQQGLIIARAFGGRQSTGVQLLLGQLDRLKSKTAEVGGGANKFGGAWQATTHTLSFQMDQLKATVGALGDKFGTYLIPKLQAAGNATKDVIAWMGRHQAAAKALAGVIGGVLGLAITVFAYTKAVAFIGATKDMASGIGSLASTIATKTGLMSASTTTADATIESQNATAGASFTAMGTEAATGAAAVDTEVASMAAAVETSDAAIEASNRAAGASFLALLGPIGIAAAAATAAEAIFHKAIQGPSGGFATTADAKRYLQSHGELPAAIPSLVAQLQKAGLIGGKNASPGAGSVGAQGIPPAIGGWSTGKIPVPSSGSNADRIAAALAAQGFSKNAIAGILGNFAQETGGGSLSGINTRDTGTGASGMGGMGIGQWTGQRRIQEMDYASLHHESPTSLQAQIGYLVQELRGSFHNVFTAMQKAPNAAAAARIFMASPAAGGFEGGTDPGGIREKAAQQAAAMLKSSGGLSTGGLDNLLGGGSGSGGGKAVMRYVNHRPVGKMTEAQWQAYQAAHPAQKSVRELLYANPFAGDSGVTQGRTDMGVDFTAPAGSKIGAIGAGIIDKIVPNWYKGQSLIEEKLSSGPDKGKFVYYAEQLNALVKQGQKVQAGQTIARVAASGTGLELGFGAGGGRTLAQSTTGYHEGQVTPAGQAFDKFLQSIGSGRYETVKGGRVTGGQGPSIMSTLAHLEQAFTAALTKSADAMAQRFNSLVQSGTIRGLSAALGENTSTAVTTPGVTRTEYGRPVFNPWGSTTRSVGSRLQSAFSGMGLSTNMGQINRASGGLVASGEANSSQQKAFQSEVVNLLANGQKALAEKLVAAHKSAMQALGQEMYAQQALKDAESLQLQATQLKDQTSMTANYDAAMLDVVKAQYQLVNDKADAEVTAIRDMTQTVTDQFSGMVQAVEDHTQSMADAASAVVTGINDQTQIQVDVLGERGLFGLNLIAQKLQVQLDIQKAGDDHQIALAQQNLDAVTSQWHAAVQTAQLNVDQVTAQQDLLAAAAQQASDTVAIRQEARIASAQAKMDAVTMHEDIAVVGPAQTAVDMNANAPKAQQDVFNNILKKATGQAGVAEGNAAQAYQGVYDSAQKIMTTAAQTAQAAQSTAQTAIASAGQTLATVTGEANAAIAGAQGGLSGAQNAASLAEAPLQSGVSVTQATASTQFSGSGATINIYGVPTEDAGAIGNAASWALRTAAV